MLTHLAAVVICATTFSGMAISGKSRAENVNFCVSPLPPAHNQCDRAVEVWWRDSKACKLGCKSTVNARENLPGATKDVLLYTWVACEKGMKPEPAIGGGCS